MKTLIINGTEIEVPEKAVGYFNNSSGNYMWISSLGALHITLSATEFIRAKADKFYSSKPFHKGKSNPLWYKSITLLSELDETTEPKLVEVKREWVMGDLFEYIDEDTWLLTFDCTENRFGIVNMRTGEHLDMPNKDFLKNSCWKYIDNVRDE